MYFIVTAVSKVENKLQISTFKTMWTKRKTEILLCVIQVKAPEQTLASLFLTNQTF